MNNNFRNFVNLYECVQNYGGIVVEGHFPWAKEIAKSLPGLSLDLPTVEKRAKIDIVMDKKNPIYVQLSDGSKLFFTLDEFKRINGKPERGKTMVVHMQRLGHDTSEYPSQITRCDIL